MGRLQRAFAGVGLIVAAVAALAPGSGLATTARAVSFVPRSVAEAEIFVNAMPVGSSNFAPLTSGHAWLDFDVTGLGTAKSAHTVLWTGTCSHRSLLLDLGALPVTGGRLGAGIEFVQPSSAMLSAFAHAHVVVTIGSAGRCGAYGTLRSCARPPAGSAPTGGWKVLVLVYPKVSFGWSDGAARHTFAASMTAPELSDAVAAGHTLGATVADWSGGAVTMTTTVKVMADTITAATGRRGRSEPFVTPDDITADLVTLAPAFRYDSVLVIFKATGTDGGQLPVSYAGLGFADRPGGATFGEALIEPSEPGARRRAIQEILVHEWLHGVQFFFAPLGYPSRPSPDDGAAAGYVADPATGWQAYLSDLMRGTVHDPAGRLSGGFTRSEWRRSSPRVAPPGGCYPGTPAPAKG